MYWMGYTSAPPGEQLCVGGYAVCRCITVALIVCCRGCRQYQWVDERGRRVKCSAAQYMDHVLSMMQSLVNDETVFPTKYGLSVTHATCPACAMSARSNLFPCKIKVRSEHMN